VLGMDAERQRKTAKLLLMSAWSVTASRCDECESLTLPAVPTQSGRNIGGKGLARVIGQRLGLH
jgi:hypothetical protein